MTLKTTYNQPGLTGHIKTQKETQRKIKTSVCKDSQFSEAELLCSVWLPAPPLIVSNHVLLPIYSYCPLLIRSSLPAATPLLDKKFQILQKLKH